MSSVQIVRPLPGQSTRYIGRDADVRNILSRLQSHARLVTVTGTGGIGKTRIALEVGTLARPHFPSGVALVELARTSNCQAVPAMIAASLNVPLPVEGTLAHRLQEVVHGPLLLILDNCEHLIDAVASMAQDLTTNTSWVCVLATSRESLAIPGEQIFPLAPLSVPVATVTDLDAQWATESVQLFVDRAQLHNPDFRWTTEHASSIGELCRRLDGIPLAIELAASHVRVLSLADMLKRMDNRFRLLNANLRGTPSRQQTLTAVFDWSYDLLTGPEQLLWQRLSVFAPNFSWDAVPIVVSDKQLPPEMVWNILTKLANKSIVTASVNGDVTRYRMLETLRDYGREKLCQTQKTIETQERHKDYYASYVRQLISDMSKDPRLQLTDVDNAIEAFEYSLKSGDSASALIISAVLAFYVHDKGVLTASVYQSLKRALDSADDDMSHDRAFALVGIGFLARALNQTEEAVRLLQQAVHIARKSGDGLLLEASLTHLAQSLPHGQSTDKLDVLQELLDIGDYWFSRTSAQCMLSQHYLWTGERDLALRHAKLCMEAAQDHEGTPYFALALGTLGAADLVTGSVKKAISSLETSVGYLDEIHHVIWLCDFLLPLARAHQLKKQKEETVSTFSKALRLLVDIDLNTYANDKSITWTGWTFIICAGLQWSSSIQRGSPIIENEISQQPKYLRDQCAVILQRFHEQSCSTKIRVEANPLSRKQWFQAMLKDLETAEAMSEASLRSGVVNPGLTPRELDVLRALSQGLSNKAIARSLYLSESTVRTYLSRVYGKLGVTSRTEALIEVRKLGLIKG